MCGTAWLCLHTFLPLLYLTLGIKRLSITNGRSFFLLAFMVCPGIYGKKRTLWEKSSGLGYHPLFLFPSGEEVHGCDPVWNLTETIQSFPMGSDLLRAIQPQFLAHNPRSHPPGALATDAYFWDLWLSSSNQLHPSEHKCRERLCLPLHPSGWLRASFALPSALLSQGSMHIMFHYSCVINVWPCHLVNIRLRWLP